MLTVSLHSDILQHPVFQCFLQSCGTTWFGSSDKRLNYMEVRWLVVAQLDPCKCTCTQKAAGRGGGITWIGCRDTMMHARRVLI